MPTALKSRKKLGFLVCWFYCVLSVLELAFCVTTYPPVSESLPSLASGSSSTSSSLIWLPKDDDDGVRLELYALESFLTTEDS